MATLLVAMHGFRHQHGIVRVYEAVNGAGLWAAFSRKGFTAVLPSPLCSSLLATAGAWQNSSLEHQGACLPGMRHALSLLIVLPIEGIEQLSNHDIAAPCSNACNTVCMLFTAAVTIGRTTGSMCLHNNFRGGQAVPVSVTAPMKVPNQVEARCTASAASGCAMYAATLVHTAAPPTYARAHPAVHVEDAGCAGATKLWVRCVRCKRSYMPPRGLLAMQLANAHQALWQRTQSHKLT